MNHTHVTSRVKQHRSTGGVAHAFFHAHSSSDEEGSGSREKFTQENLGQQALHARERQFVDERKQYDGPVRKKRSAEEKSSKMEIKKCKKEAVVADLAKECCTKGCLG